MTFKPSTRLLVSLSPSYDHDFTAQQYVTAVTDPAVSSPFGGTRYVFGRLEQKTFSLNTRVNTTFTPNLTLELFAQPFLASGRYSSFKEFAEAKSRRMFLFGLVTYCNIASNTTAAVVRDRT